MGYVFNQQLSTGNLQPTSWKLVLRGRVSAFQAFSGRGNADPVPGRNADRPRVQGGVDAITEQFGRRLLKVVIWMTNIGINRIKV